MGKKERTTGGKRQGVVLVLVLVFLCGPVQASPKELADPLLKTLAGILLEAREDGADVEKLARRVASLGAEALPPLFFGLEQSGRHFREDRRKEVLEQSFKYFADADLSLFLRRVLEADKRESNVIRVLRVLSLGGRRAHLSLLVEIAGSFPPRHLASPTVFGPIRTAARVILTRDPSAFRALPNLWRECPDGVRPLLLDALEETAGPQTMVGLLALLRVDEKSSAKVLERVARTPVRGPEQIPQTVHGTVQTLLCSRSPVDRRIAAAAAGRLHSVSCMGHLVEMLSDPEPLVPEAALKALQVMSGLPIGAREADWQAWLKREVAWLNEGMDGEVNRLQSPRPEDVLAALTSLRRHRLQRDHFHGQVVDQLQHEEPEIRTLTCLLLGALGHPAALSPLSEALEDGEAAVVSAASKALARITGLSQPEDPLGWRDILTFLD